MDKPSYVPIVLAFTPDYIIPASTLILSILKHSKKDDRFQIICILAKGMQKQVSAHFDRWDEPRLEFKYVSVSSQLDHMYIDQKYTASASYRLLLGDLLEEYDKVIYCDCDMIIRQNLAELYRSVSLKDNLLAAVYESPLDFQLPYLQQLGLKWGEYFNSGFLVMNLQVFRNEKLSLKLLELANNPSLQFPDQDALNMLCQDRVLALEPKYNSIRTFFLPQYKKEFLACYSLCDLKQVMQSGTIHYTGAKPWRSYTVNFEIWWAYYQLLPGKIKDDRQLNKKLAFLAKLLNIKPIHSFYIAMLNLYRSCK